MSTTEPSGDRSGDVRRRPPGRRVNPTVIVVLVVFAAVLLVVGLVRGEVWGGVAPAALLVATAAALVFFARRSDTVALLGDDVYEERHVQIHRAAALASFNLFMAVIVVAGVVDVVRGGDGDPYAWLALVGGVLYVGSVLVLSRRS